MKRPNYRMTDVIYNGAEQAFEAVVRFETADGPHHYGCRFHAPLSTDATTAKSGLLREARRQARQGTDLMLRLALRDPAPVTPFPRKVQNTWWTRLTQRAA